MHSHLLHHGFLLGFMHPLDVNRRFGRKCRLHLKVLIISFTNNEYKTFSIKSLDVLSKRLFNFKGLQGAITQKTEIVIITVLRSSVPSPQWSNKLYPIHLVSELFR